MSGFEEFPPPTPDSDADSDSDVDTADSDDEAGSDSDFEAEPEPEDFSDVPRRWRWTTAIAWLLATAAVVWAMTTNVERPPL